jgi:NADH-quinone oxidoreductase subunit F
MQLVQAKQDESVFRNLAGIDPRDSSTYGEYYRLARALAMQQEDLIGEIRSAGLRGREGAGLPVADSWQLCLEQAQAEKYLICHACDTHPQATVIRTLLASNPHAVLEGMLICAYAVGATKIFLYLDRTDRSGIELVTAAISQMAANRLVGAGISKVSFCWNIEVVEGEASLICSESTALIQAMEGNLPMAGRMPPHPEVCGYLGKPTLVHSAETLAHVSAILQEGSAWYAALGSKHCSGTKLLAVTGSIQKPGVIEVAMGTTLRSIIYDSCGGLLENRECKFLWVGGPAGGCISAAHMDTALEYETLEEMEVIMGSGSIIVYDQTACAVEVAKECLVVCQQESCGKCVLCREGTYQMQEILADMTTGKSRANDRDLLLELIQAVKKGSLCSLGKAAVNPVSTLLKHFDDEVEAHMKRKKCPALVCKKYVTFHILPEKCTGCSACREACPEEAIEGDDGLIHVIDTTVCTKCGTCLDICRSVAAAVVKAGAIKPATPKQPIAVGAWKRR